MIDYELLDRMQNGSHRVPPPDMPTWKYVAVVVGLQFGPLIALAAIFFLCGKLF